MRVEEIKEIFDNLIALPEGKAIRIGCESRAEQDSVRVQFYKQRANYVAQLGNMSKDISIQRLTHNDAVVELTGQQKYYVVLRVLSSKRKIEVVEEDGTTKPFTFEEKTVTPDEEALTPDQQRMYDLMLSDGFSEEEALATMKEMTT